MTEPVRDVGQPTPYQSMLALLLEDTFVERIAKEYDSDVGEMTSETEDGHFDYPSLPESPRPAQIRDLIQTAFWASLLEEEGRFHSFSLAFFPADEARPETDVMFVEPLKFTPEIIAKTSPAVPPTKHIGVWESGRNAELIIWGFSDLEYSLPGIIVQAHGKGEITVSLPLGPRAIATVKNGARFIHRYRGLLPSRDSDGKPDGSERLDRWESDLKEIARAMRSHRHGGTLLIVPDNSDSWRESIHRLVFECRPYTSARRALEKRQRALREQERLEREEERIFFDPPSESFAAREALRMLGQLTAVDGAVVVTRSFVVLGYGAKIKEKHRSDGEALQKALVREPLEGSHDEEKDISKLGGTRHQSAAQFAFDQRDSITIVASQDGRVSFMAWDNAQQQIVVTQHAELVL